MRLYVSAFCTVKAKFYFEENSRMLCFEILLREKHFDSQRESFTKH